MGAGRDQLNVMLVEDVDGYSDAIDYGTAYAVQDFIAKLQGYQLEAHEIEVLVDRFVFNKTFGQIAKEGSWVDPKTVHRVYKRAMAKAEQAFIRNKEGKH